MPYTGPDDEKLPEAVAELPEAERAQWVAVFNEVHAETGDEGRAASAAWAAVRADEEEEPERRSTVIKAIDGRDGAIGGYLVVFGDTDNKDLQGEYFTSKTELGLDWYPRRPVLYHHGLDSTLGPEMIGQIENLKMDEFGVWAEAQLDLRSRWVQKVMELVNRGVLNWSSGSLPHLVEVEQDGHIRRWPIIEGSTTPSPAEPRGTNIAPAKHYSEKTTVIQAFKSAGLDVPGDLDMADADNSTPAYEIDGEQYTVGDFDLPFAATHTHTQESEEMAENAVTVDIVKQLMKEQFKEQEIKAAAEREQVELKAKAERAEKAERELAELKAQMGAGGSKRLPHRESEPEALNDPQLGAVPQIRVASKFDGLSVSEMATVGVVMKAAGKTTSSEWSKAWAEKVVREGVPVPRGIKADELDHTTNTGFGAEWVNEIWSGNLWEKARNENVVFPRIDQFMMEAKTVNREIEGADPTVYYVGETTDEDQLTFGGANNPTPDSKVGTGEVVYTAKKLALRVPFSTELTEDSTIPIIQQFERQGSIAMLDAVDNVIINGDTATTATGNINSDDATPTAKSKYLAVNGIRKQGLVTNTAQGYDAGNATISLALMRDARAQLPKRYGSKPDNLLWIADYSTWIKMLNMDEFLTLDKAGPGATNISGVLMFADGIEVVCSGEMELTEPDGKINATPVSQDRGNALLIVRNRWSVGVRRQIRLITEMIASADAYQMYAHMRLDVQPFDTESSVNLYNIQV
jgi:HK97 family phage major capsid protein